MTVDNELLDRRIDEQLLRLGEHRERQVSAESIGYDPRPAERTVSHLSLLAVAAAALVLLGSGAYLAVRAGGGTGTVDAVDAVGDIDVAVEADSGRGQDDGSDGRGLFSAPSESYPARGESDPDDGSARGVLVDDADDPAAPPTTDDVEETERTGDQTERVEPTTTSSASAAGSDPVITEQEAQEPRLDDLEAAGTALSETSTAMVELTEGLAGSGAASADDSSTVTGDPQDRQQLANDVAAGVAGNQPACATTELNPNLSISINFVDCPGDDGRPVNGTLVASIKRWIPFELAVVVDEMTIGDDRLWMDATITFSKASRNGPLEPVLKGEIATESRGVVTHIEGTARFLEGRTVINGQLGYLTGSRVTEANRVIYRPGETVVAATFVDVSVGKGNCAPSSGTATYQTMTVAGVRDGGETDDVQLVDFDEQLVAGVTYLPTTPISGLVDLRIGGHRSSHRLLVPCR